VDHLLSGQLAASALFDNGTLENIPARNAYEKSPPSIPVAKTIYSAISLCIAVLPRSVPKPERVAEEARTSSKASELSFYVWCGNKTD
jgi:hypothetical protein